MELQNKHLSIKDLNEDDRPREKLVAKGRQNLTDAELLAIILGSGNRNETAVQLAQRILSQNSNNLNQVARLNLNELKKFKGVGEAKAVNIVAAFELGRRRAPEEMAEQVKITSSKIAFNLVNKFLSDLPHEEFWMLLLNRANKVIKEIFVSKGGISSTVVDIRVICKSALENNASGIILAHNHPSGQLQPSSEDRQITKKLKEALKLFDIVLLDHLIVGDQKYYSFADDGQI